MIERWYRSIDSSDMWGLHSMRAYVDSVAPDVMIVRRNVANAYGIIPFESGVTVGIVIRSSSFM